MPRTATRVDMTHGPILPTAVRFALPICAGNVLQQLYSTVDTLVIGNYCDASALAAVATSSQPLEILLCIFLGIGSGVSILVSQAAGRDDADRQRELARTAVWLLYATALPLTVLGLLLGPLLLRFMQVPPDAWDGAIVYLRITTLGCLGNMGYNLNAGILRGLGNSRTSLWMLMVSCVVNIVGDLALVGGFGLGVGGAAFATAAAMMLAWAFSILYLLRRVPELRFPVLPAGHDRETLREILHVGVPLGLNNALYSFGHLLLQTLYNTQGSVFVAGCSVASKLSSLANIAITSFFQRGFGLFRPELRRRPDRPPAQRRAAHPAVLRGVHAGLRAAAHGVRAAGARPFHPGRRGAGGGRAVCFCGAAVHLVLCGVQRHYELPERPGRNPLPDFCQRADPLGRAHPRGLGACGGRPWRLGNGRYLAELHRRHDRDAALLPHPPLAGTLRAV